MVDRIQSPSWFLQLEIVGAELSENVSAILTHGPNGHLPGGPMGIRVHANLCTTMLLYCVFTLHCNKCNSMLSLLKMVLPPRSYLGEIETHCFWCTKENVTSGKHQRPEWNSILWDLPVRYRNIISVNLKSVFPNVEIALQVFMCMMVTKCTWERSFSRLKCALYHDGATLFEFAFIHVHEKWHPEDNWLQVNNKAILWIEMPQMHSIIKSP